MPCSALVTRCRQDDRHEHHEAWTDKIGAGIVAGDYMRDPHQCMARLGNHTHRDDQAPVALHVGCRDEEGGGHREVEDTSDLELAHV